MSVSLEIQPIHSPLFLQRQHLSLRGHGLRRGAGGLSCGESRDPRRFGKRGERGSSSPACSRRRLYEGMAPRSSPRPFLLHTPHSPRGWSEATPPSRTARCGADVARQPGRRRPCRARSWAGRRGRRRRSPEQAGRRRVAVAPVRLPARPAAPRIWRQRSRRGLHAPAPARKPGRPQTGHACPRPPQARLTAAALGPRGGAALRRPGPAAAARHGACGAGA